MATNICNLSAVGWSQNCYDLLTASPALGSMRDPVSKIEEGDNQHWPPA